MKELQLLKRKLEREKLARKQAEGILETKALELHRANQELIQLNESLEQKIKARTLELASSEKRYRQIVESANDFIFRTDPDGYFIYINPIANQKLGYTSEEVIGKHFTDFVLPAYQEGLMQMYISLRDRKVLNSYKEFPIVAKNGDIIWVGQNVQFISEDGHIKEVTGVARDISERKITEDALMTTQHRLMSLIANLHSGVLVEDENRKVVLANKLFCSLLKIPAAPNEMKGMNCELSAIRSKHLFKEPDVFVERIDELLAHRKTEIGEEIHTAEGKILERDYIPIWSGKKYLGHLWQYRDITEEYIAEEKLKRSEEKYRGIIENMELGLMEVDQEQKILKVYDWFCDMTGYTSEELVGKNAAEVFLPENFKAEMERQNQNRKKGQAGVYEMQIRKKGGELIWVLISGAPILNEQGEMTGSIGIHYDITDRKNLELDLEEAKRVAEEAELAEKQFLARMSHEIRTPLNAVIGMSHLIEDTKLSEEQKDYVDSLKSSSDILQKLISDILDLSKITAGGMELNPRTFDLAGLVKSLQKTFQLKLENSPVDILVTIDDALQTMMIGDDLLLNQILLNLIGNAVKFTQKGEIRIDVRIINKVENDYRIEFKISDTGIGIPEDRIKVIFENFKQADNEIRFQFGGTGLGLPITKQLVELQGGQIRVESQLNQGTDFIFWLPYQDSGKRLGFKQSTKSANQGATPKVNKILIAEDNYMNRKYIAALFNKWELNFDFAMNGKQAVEAASQEKYDIIFMDISMPELDGYDATIQIRNISNINQDTPIIALTASAMISKKDRAYEVGMTDYLAKPFKPVQLKELIKKYSKPAKNNTSLSLVEIDDFIFNNNLDTGHLEYLYKGDIEYAHEMFSIFTSYTLVEYQKLNEFFQSGDIKKLHQLAHKIKPNFSLVGLTEIEKQLLRLEQLAEENADKKIIAKTLSSIDKSLSHFQPIIEEELEKMKILI